MIGLAFLIGVSATIGSGSGGGGSSVKDEPMEESLYLVGSGSVTESYEDGLVVVSIGQSSFGFTEEPFTYYPYEDVLLRFDLEFIGNGMLRIVGVRIDKKLD
jgi:hypothetical protein